MLSQLASTGDMDRRIVGKGEESNRRQPKALSECKKMTRRNSSPVLGDPRNTPQAPSNALRRLSMSIKSPLTTSHVPFRSGGTFSFSIFSKSFIKALASAFDGSRHTQRTRKRAEWNSTRARVVAPPCWPVGPVTTIQGRLSTDIALTNDDETVGRCGVDPEFASRGAPRFEAALKLEASSDRIFPHESF